MSIRGIVAVSALAAAACAPVPPSSRATVPRAQSSRLSGAEYSALARDFLNYVRRIPTAERSPSIQSSDDETQQSLLRAYQRLDSRQAAQLEDEILIDSIEPKLLKLVDGALLCDDFESNDVDLFRWHVQKQCEGVEVTVGEGVLRIHGAPTGGRTLGPGFTGLVSKTFADRDVELVAKVRLEEAPPRVVGEHIALVHLCGTQPDWFAHVEFGMRMKSLEPRIAAMRRFLDEEGDITPVDLPYALGEWYTVRIRHDGAKNKVDAWVESRFGRCQPVSGAPLFFTSSKAELNILNTVAGAPIDARFDNCRLYRSPRSAPLVIQALSMPGSGQPQSDVQVRVEVVGADSPAIEGTTDTLGRCELLLPDDLMYPVRVRLTARRGGALVLDMVSPEVEGIRGVYPGDVWLVLLGRKTFMKTDARVGE